MDQCGFQLAELPTSFLAEIQAFLRANVIKLTNPIDLGDLFDLDLYGKIAERTLAMTAVDGMVYLHTYAAATEGEKSVQLFERLHQLARQVNKPIAIHAATVADELSRLKRTMDGPLFSEPSDAVHSLALLRDFRHQVVRPRTRPEGPADERAVRSVIDACRAEGRDPLIQEAMAIGTAYGVPVIPGVLVTDEEAAVSAAENLGYPVAMKIVSREVSHKSDFGGVQLNLRTKNSVRSAWTDMMRSVATKAPGARIEGALVQPMVLGERDVIVGAKLDPNFGHVVLVGMGGIFVEVFRDTALRVAPFERDTAEAMLKELRIYPILAGARGQGSADIPALVEVVLAVARLVTDFPEIVELDLNPVRMLPAGQGCLALDARMSLALG
jgi:acetyltransferase